MELLELRDNIETNFGLVCVATDELPIGYETMVYPLNKSNRPIYKKPLEQFTKRYNTKLEARKGHIDTVGELCGYENSSH